MSTSDLVRIDGSVHINPSYIVSIVPAPMLSNAVRFDSRLTNGDVHAWPIGKDENAEDALSRLIERLRQN